MPERSNGKVFLEILDSWPRLGKLVLLIFATSAVVFLLAYEILRHLPSNASEIQLGATDSSHVVIRQPTKGGGSSAVLMVSPQGWNQTSIQVREGEFYTINAGGRIQTSLYDLNLALEARRKAENRIDKEHAPGSVYKPLYYTEAERRGMVPVWPWCGPDGETVEAMKQANPESLKRRLLMTQPYGRLIGAFSDTDFDPLERPDLVKTLAPAIFDVGSKVARTKATQKLSGYLYFAVNDVKDGDYPDLLLVDNIGSYWVRIDVNSN